MSIRTALAVAALALFSGVAGAQTKPWKLDRVFITFWCPPPATDEMLSAVVHQGYNLTSMPEAGLDVARKLGLKTMLEDGLLNPASLDDPAKRAKLDALVDRVKRNPAMEAYFIVDEPSAPAFTGLGRLVAYLRERDPAHFAYINLLPTYANNDQLGTKGDKVTAYAEYLRLFHETVKPALISYDHYHFFKDGDGKEYFLNLGMVRKSALDNKVPFLNIIQASTIEKVWRLVNADELRWLVYTTLAYGGRGISYFLYWGPTSYGGLYQDGKPTPLVDSVAVLNREIAALSPVLMKLDSIGVYHTAPVPDGAEVIPASSPVTIVGSGEYVLGLFGKKDDVTAFMIVNRSYKNEAAAQLKLARGFRRIEMYDRSAKRWVLTNRPDANGTVMVSLRPGDGNLFRLVR